jgi:protein subunit release factor B
MFFYYSEQLKITASRSGGPGGQNANKVNSKVDVRFHVDDAKWLDNELKEKVKILVRITIFFACSNQTINPHCHA